MVNGGRPMTRHVQSRAAQAAPPPRGGRRRARRDRRSPRSPSTAGVPVGDRRRRAGLRSAGRRSQSLGQAGGATEAFAIGVSFAGILVLVLFIANVAGEFSQGTFRTLLMRQPRRVALLAGKMAALLAFAAVVLAVAELLTVVASSRDRPDARTSRRPSWFGLDALGEAASDYATALFGVAAWASLGHGARGLRALDPGRAGDRHRVVGPVRAPARRTHGPPRASGSPACCWRRSPSAVRPRCPPAGR